MIINRAFKGDTFWDLHIIDMHCHLGPTSMYYNPEAQIEQMIEDADRIGIEKLCIAPHAALSYDHTYGNMLTYEAIKNYPKRIYGYLCLNPNKENEIRCQFDKYYYLPQFIGVKIHPSWHRYPINGIKYKPVFENVLIRGGFVLTHSWEADEYSSSSQCEDIIKEYPEINFILAHSLGTTKGIQEAINLVNKYNNVYMDTSAFKYSNFTIEEIMRDTDNNKVFFGSDMPYHDLRDVVSRILFADLDDQVKIKLLSTNFTDFLMNGTRNNL
jgi:predicted TIM-barrel fold metal-dependent hydrolase